MFVAEVDLSRIGSLDVTPESWYLSLIDTLINKFDLEDKIDLDDFHNQYKNLTPSKWLEKFN